MTNCQANIYQEDDRPPCESSFHRTSLFTGEYTYTQTREATEFWLGYAQRTSFSISSPFSSIVTRTNTGRTFGHLWRQMYESTTFWNLSLTWSLQRNRQSISKLRTMSGTRDWTAVSRTKKRQIFRPASYFGLVFSLRQLLVIFYPFAGRWHRPFSFEGPVNLTIRDLELPVRCLMEWCLI